MRLLICLLLLAPSKLDISDAKLALSGGVGELKPTLTCTAKATGDCKITAIVECFVQGDDKWYPIGTGTVEMSEKDNVSELSGESKPLSFDGTVGGEFEPGVKYKAVIRIYPVSADEIEDYKGKPAFTGSIIGTIRE